MKKRNLPGLPDNRATGLSTSEALETLAKAIANPGRPQYFHDHSGTLQMAMQQQNMAKVMVGRMGLQFMTFGYGNGYYVRFDLYEPEQPAEEIGVDLSMNADCSAMTLMAGEKIIYAGPVLKPGEIDKLLEDLNGNQGA